VTVPKNEKKISPNNIAKVLSDKASPESLHREKCLAIATEYCSPAFAQPGNLHFSL